MQSNHFDIEQQFRFVKPLPVKPLPDQLPFASFAGSTRHFTQDRMIAMDTQLSRVQTNELSINHTPLNRSWHTGARATNPPVKGTHPQDVNLDPRYLMKWESMPSDYM